MSSLPEELIEENILTRLPVKSISRFRCVSKNWYHLFRNPKFIKKHLNLAKLMNNCRILVYTDGNTPTDSYLYSIDNDVLSTSSASSPFSGHALKIDYPFMTQEYSPDIIGSCNGLVCIKPFHRSICIWNLATREYRQIPEPSTSDDFNFMEHGFGFDTENDDYKVLGILCVHIFEEGEGFEARIYSLASNSWKNLGTVPYNFCLSNRRIFHDGVLHWTGLKSDVIVCFDISDETFHEVSLPNNIAIDIEDPPCNSNLGIWEGKLCLLHWNHMEDPDTCTHQNDHCDVWIMMDNKWSKHLKITTHIKDMYYKWPIQNLQNGEILFDGDRLLLYDPNLERARALKIHGLPKIFWVETYIETLVTLKSGTYVGQ